MMSPYVKGAERERELGMGSSQMISSFRIAYQEATDGAAAAAARYQSS